MNQIGKKLDSRIPDIRPLDSGQDTGYPVWSDTGYLAGFLAFNVQFDVQFLSLKNFVFILHIQSKYS